MDVRGLGPSAEDPAAVVRTGLDGVRTALRRGTETLRTDPTARLMILGAAIGALGGACASAFHAAVAAASAWVLGSSSPGTDPIPVAAALIGPVVGGLLAGLAIRYGTREARPLGIADVVDATWNRGGELSLRSGVASAAGAALAIGAGHSGGREGPVVQLAGAVSSHLCRRLGVPRNRARVLVAAGAAAGVAASFNTPIGGAFFALEIILGSFALDMFGPVVAATVTGTVVGQALLGDRLMLVLPAFTLKSPAELPLYLVLGALSGLLAMGFQRAMFAADGLARRLPLPGPAVPALAGLGVGALGVAGATAVMGNGYAYVEGLLAGEIAVATGPLLLILVAKLVATGLTYAGRSGVGLFAPSLFVGAVAGTAFGQVVHGLWPNLTESPGAYGIVGMGAVAAAVTSSPITLALMLFEMTHNYAIILPLLLALAVAGIVVSAFGQRSLFVEQLAARGIVLDRSREELVMQNLTVADLLREGDATTIAADAPFEQLAACFLRHHVDLVFVVEEGGRLHGVVELIDIKGQLVAPTPGLTVADVETRDVPTLTERQTVGEALRRFFEADLDALPVVDAEGRLVGVLHERDVIGALDREVLRHDALLARIESGGPGERRTDYFELPPGRVMRAVPVGPSLAGQDLRQLGLTRRYHVTVLAVVREDEAGHELRLPADADLRLQDGDRLVVMGPAADVEALCAERDDLALTEEVERPPE